MLKFHKRMPEVYKKGMELRDLCHITKDKKF